MNPLGESIELLDRLVDGGHAGGAVVFTGSPADLCTAAASGSGSHTGVHPARHVHT
jgi:excinuclease UvrABC ATPase subunit